MKIRDVTTGMPFRFAGGETVYIARGEGWYDSPEGYAGGPWCEDYTLDRDVEALPTTLHAFSFEGLTDDEVLLSYHRMTMGIGKTKRTEGDRAIARHELTIIGLEPREVQEKLRYLMK